MDVRLREQERAWETGEKPSLMDRLRFYSRAGQFEEGVRRASSEELWCHFQGWGENIPLSPMLMRPSMFFVDGHFDADRFELWSVVQDRFPLRLQADEDVTWFNQIPPEGQSRIQDSNILRPIANEFHIHLLHSLLPRYLNDIYSKIDFLLLKPKKELFDLSFSQKLTQFESKTPHKLQQYFSSKDKSFRERPSPESVSMLPP